MNYGESCVRLCKPLQSFVGKGESQCRNLQKCYHYKIMIGILIQMLIDRDRIGFPEEISLQGHLKVIIVAENSRKAIAQKLSCFEYQYYIGSKICGFKPLNLTSICWKMGSQWRDISLRVVRNLVRLRSFVGAFMIDSRTVGLCLGRATERVEGSDNKRVNQQLGGALGSY